jgi:putative hydrolase of the HAD superfamily
MVRLPLNGILIDLDHTLWDFARNSREAIHDIFKEENLDENHGIEFDTFHSTYLHVNEAMWDDYRKQKINKEQLRVGRFNETLKKININNYALAERISDRYVEISPNKTHLFPGSHEVLAYLKQKYPIALVTNGFNEVQFIKIKQSGLEPYFNAVVTSEDAGVQKPHKEIFFQACAKIGTLPQHCVMIGDNWEADILGALNAGIQAIHFDPDRIHKQPADIRIYNLRELQSLL